MKLIKLISRLEIKMTILVLSLVLLYGLLSPLFPQAAPLANYDDYVESAMKDWVVPGVAIAIVKNGRIVHARGYGVRKDGQKDLVDANTIFAIASNSKAFTTTAMGMLVQEGKVSWDDLVLKYLPDFQMYDAEATRKLNIRDLFSHRAGLALWGGDWTWWGSTYSRADIVHKIRYQEPTYDFRTGYAYTNQLFLVGGEIIPVVTGKSWDDFVRERLFQPLEMNRSSTSVAALEGMDNVATAHLFPNEKLIPVPYVKVDNIAPAASINSSVNDLANWLIMQLDNGVFNGKSIVSQEILQETRKPHNMIALSSNALKFNPATHFLAYGLGWFLRDYHGRLLVNHTGGLDGMYSYTGFLPEEKLGVVVLTNREDHSLMTSLALKAIDRFLGVSPRDWSADYLERSRAGQERRMAAEEKRKSAKDADGRPVRPLKEYAGQYHHPIYGSLDIEMVKGKLVVKLGPHPEVTGSVGHWKYDTLQIQWSNPAWRTSLAHFQLDDKGEISGFRMKVRPDWIDTIEYEFVKHRQ